MTAAAGRHQRHLITLAFLLVVALVLAACGAGASVATSSVATSSPASAGPAETAAPPAATPPSSDEPDGDPGPGGNDLFVVPKPGQLDVHPSAADSLAASVDGRHVVVTISYTSGVEPCSVLDTIFVQRGQGSFAITLRQGHGPGDQVCIMIARMMKTRVDLGDLDPGNYTISDATGGADAIQVVVG